MTLFKSMNFAFFAKVVNDTHRKKLCFTQLITRMAAWLLVVFSICLDNQLSCIKE